MRKYNYKIYNNTLAYYCAYLVFLLRKMNCKIDENIEYVY